MIFDAVLPFGFELADNQFKELVCEKINEYDSKLFNAAVKLHGSTLNNLPLGNRLRVDQLDLDQVKSVGGTAMNCAVMKFSLLSN